MSGTPFESPVPTDIPPTPPDADIMPAKAERAETSYIVLQGATGEVDTWRVASEGEMARSAEAATRAYAEGMKPDSLDRAGVLLVAVPARSWKPVRIKPQTVTTLLIEEA